MKNAMGNIIRMVGSGKRNLAGAECERCSVLAVRLLRLYLDGAGLSRLDREFNAQLCTDLGRAYVRAAAAAPARQPAAGAAGGDGARAAASALVKID